MSPIDTPLPKRIPSLCYFATYALCIHFQIPCNQTHRQRLHFSTITKLWVRFVSYKDIWLPPFWEFLFDCLLQSTPLTPIWYLRFIQDKKGMEWISWQVLFLIRICCHICHLINIHSSQRPLKQTSTCIFPISTLVTMMGMLRGGGVSNCLSSTSRLLLKQPSNGQLAPLPHYQGQHHHHHVIIITINIVNTPRIVHINNI